MHDQPSVLRVRADRLHRSHTRSFADQATLLRDGRTDQAMKVPHQVDQHLGIPRVSQLAELQGREIESYEVRFERGDVEAAAKLGAAHSPQPGWPSLIVGQDIADQLAADQVAAALKAHKDRDNAAEEAEATRPADSASAEGYTGDAGPAERSEDELAAERRREREE